MNKDRAKPMYRVTVLYTYDEGQTNGRMDVDSADETEAIKQVLDYMRDNMKLYPSYTINMVKVERLLHSSN